MTNPPAHLINAMRRWREAYNPIRGLTIERCIRHLEEYQQGIMANIQWLFAHIEAQDATLLTVIENLDSAIGSIDWDIAQISPDSRRYDRVLAAEQEACLRAAYENIENLSEAISHLTLARFRGFAHLAPWCRLDGRLDTLYRLQPIDQWNMVRQGHAGPWAYNPSAEPISYDQTREEYRLGADDLICRERKRYVNRIGLIKFIRSTTAEKDWDAYVEIYGIPACFIVLPQNIPTDKEGQWLELAQQGAEGASAVLPGGSDVKTLSENRAVQPFQARLEWLEKQLVIAATGGMLTVLAESGSGTLAGSVHKTVFDTLAAAEAKKCAETLNAWLDKRLLNAAFPGKPHLAYFDLSRPEEKDVGEVVTQICALRAAGIDVAKDQIEEMTGYTIEAIRDVQQAALADSSQLTAVSRFRDGEAYGTQKHSQNGSGGPTTSSASAVSDDIAPRYARTCQLSAVSCERLSAAKERVADLWLRLRREGYAPLAQRVYALLAATGAEQQTLARALLDDLPALGHELMLSAPLGDALAQELQRAYLSTLKEATFSTPPAATCAAGENNGCRAKDPATCRVHGNANAKNKVGQTGNWKSPGSGQREGETKSHRDEYGTFDEAKLADDPRANRARAKSVLTHLLAKEGGSEPKALYRKDTGWIGIDYGEPGNPDNDYKGGHGLAHILAKHPGAEKNLVDVLQKGECYKHDTSRSKLYLIQGNSVAVLTKHRTGRLLITDYEEVPDQQIAHYKSAGRYHAKGEN
ncbi:MAG: DUF935 family protein [Candidatus Spyradenecus sp.]